MGLNKLSLVCLELLKHAAFMDTAFLPLSLWRTLFEHLDREILDQATRQLSKLSLVQEVTADG